MRERKNDCLAELLSWFYWWWWSSVNVSGWNWHGNAIWFELTPEASGMRTMSHGYFIFVDFYSRNEPCLVFVNMRWKANKKKKKNCRNKDDHIINWISDQMMSKLFIGVLMRPKQKAETSAWTMFFISSNEPFAVPYADISNCKCYTEQFHHQRQIWASQEIPCCPSDPTRWKRRNHSERENSSITDRFRSEGILRYALEWHNPERDRPKAFDWRRGSICSTPSRFCVADDSKSSTINESKKCNPWSPHFHAEQQKEKSKCESKRKSSVDQPTSTTNELTMFGRFWQRYSNSSWVKMGAKSNFFRY